MPHRVVIRLFASGASEWLGLDRGGKLVSRPSAGLPTESAQEVDLLLPPEQVLLLDAPRLARRASQLAKALPFAIEEQLAGPVELQHVAFDERAVGASVPVAVVARKVLRGALDQLSAAGQSVDRCHSPAQLLPLAPDRLSVLVDGDEALLRWSVSGATSCPVNQLDDTLSMLRDSGAAWTSVRLWRTQRSAPLQLSVPAQEDVQIAAALPWLADQFSAAVGPDLLQGEFRPRRSGGRSLAQWRWAAGLAATAIVAGGLHSGAERIALERHAEARRGEMEAVLREALPGTQRIVDPVAQLGAELDRRGGASVGGALPLLAKIAPLIAGSGRFTIESLDYRSGTLELTVSAPDVASLDSLRASLAGLPPLQVELTSALPGSNGYEGRLRIRDSAS